MVVYAVKWSHDTNLSKGKGRATLNEQFIIFSVLCRNSSDAVRCLQYHFRHHYKNLHGFTLDDGEIQLKRSVIDSRGFSVDYLYMDDIPEPLRLSDLKRSLSTLR